MISIITIIGGLEQRKREKSLMIFADVTMRRENISREIERKRMWITPFQTSNHMWSASKFHFSKINRKKNVFNFVFPLIQFQFARWSMIKLAHACALDLIRLFIQCCWNRVCCWLGNMKHRKRYFSVSPSYYTVHSVCNYYFWTTNNGTTSKSYIDDRREDTRSYN